MNSSIVIAGGTGLIGTACRDLFIKEGYTVYILTRRMPSGPREISWNPDKQWIAQDVISNALAVINFCGLSLADKRWTPKYKQQLLDSRVIPAHFLHTLISRAAIPPACYIGASGIGIYADHGTEPIFDDSDLVGSGFVSHLVKLWEQAHLDIPLARNLVLRIGVVISAKGGFLGKLIPPARFGLFPYFGNGNQLLSWIHIYDLTRMILHCIRAPAITGIYHATAPESISQHNLMRTMKAVSGKPGIVFSVPAILLRGMFGQMASLLFESADVRPDKIMHSGFQYQYADMRSALEEALNSKAT